MNSEEQTDALRAQIQALHERQMRLMAQFEKEQHGLASLARSVWQVEEDERRRLAGELHDGIGQNLTALKHQLATIGSGCSDNPDLRARVEASLELCSETLDQTRRLSRLLRPQILDDLGLLPALDWLARTLGEPAGLQIEVAAAEQLDECLDQGISTLLFRLAQEALTNVVRHAHAQHAVVRLDRRRDFLVMQIWDDGCGFDVSAALEKSSRGGSLGLNSMRQRIQMYGGWLDISEVVDGGTHIRCHVPCAASGKGISKS